MAIGGAAGWAISNRGGTTVAVPAVPRGPLSVLVADFENFPSCPP